MAQQPPDATLAQLNAIPIDTLCSTRGTNNIAFGSTDLPPSGFNIPGMDKRDAPESLRPFATMALDASKWSNHFYRATYEMPASKADAPQLIAAIAQRFRGAGWIEKKGSGDDGGSLLDPTPAPGDVNFYSAAGAMSGNTRKGARVAIAYLPGQISVECTDMALLEQHAKEELGDLPPGTPRPQPPTLPPPATLDPAICTTPAGRADIAAVAGSGKPNALVRYAGARNNYGDRLTAWKMDRLKKSGKVSDDRMMALMVGSMRAGSPDGNPMAAFDRFMKVIDQAGEAAKRGEAGDVEGECRATVTLFKGLEEIDRINGGQWRAMDQALDAEAKRVGVSWD
jgi:hypothetical protein